MRNIFGSGEKGLKHATEALEKEMYEQMKESGKLIEFNRPSIQVKAGERGQVWLGFMNAGDVVREFKIQSSGKSSIGNNDCSILDVSYLGSVIKVSPKDIFVSPVNVGTPLGMDKGTCVVQIEVCPDPGADACPLVGLGAAETHTVQLSVDVI